MPRLSLIERLAAKQYLVSNSHWYCHYCLAPLLRPDDDNSQFLFKSGWMTQDGRRFCIYAVPATIDHIVPTSKGGTNDESNLVLCCGTCNSAKGNRPAWQFETLLKEWLWRNRCFMQVIYSGWGVEYYNELTEAEMEFLWELDQVADEA